MLKTIAANTLVRPHPYWSHYPPHHTPQADTGQTVLQAEDHMDDGTRIKLGIQISDEVVM